MKEYTTKMEEMVLGDVGGGGSSQVETALGSIKQLMDNLQEDLDKFSGKSPARKQLIIVEQLENLCGPQGWRPSCSSASLLPTQASRAAGRP